MKKFLTVMIFAASLFIFSIDADAASIQIFIDGEAVTSDVSPEIKNNRTMVPLRVISENLGAGVQWENSIVTLTQNDEVVTLNLKNGTVSANGKPVQLDVKPYIKNNRTMVPIRFIAETFGSIVDYKNRVVTIETERVMINDRKVTALRQENELTMGSTITQIKANAYINAIYKIYTEHKGEKKEAPAYIAKHDFSNPGTYYKSVQHEFFDNERNVLKRFEVYSLYDQFPEDLLAQFPETLLYDVTESQWYLFNKEALNMLDKLYRDAQNNGLVEVISSTL